MDSERAQRALAHIERQDLSDVLSSDEHYVKHILRDIEMFDPVEVGLDYQVRHIGTNYDVTISGWRSGFVLLDFYAQFLARVRDARYEYISENAAVICPATMELIIQIRDRAVTKQEDDPKPKPGVDVKQYAENKLNRMHYVPQVQENVNDAELDANDKKYVEPILCDVLMSDPALNQVKIHVKRIDDYYNCLFSGWQSPIRIKAFCTRFMDTSNGNRDTKYRNVLPNAEVMPEQEGEGGPYLIVRICARAPAANDFRRNAYE